MNVELREYQKEAVQVFLSASKGTVKAAPGSGKTIIALACAAGLTLRNGFTRTLVITPTIDLTQQWQRFFQRYGFGVGEYDVITYAKAARLVDREDFWPRYDFIIADEMHHLQVGPAFMRILIPIFKARYALGLSATPPTDPENTALRVLPVVYEYSLAESREEGYAAPVEVHPIAVQLTDEERKKYAELTEEIRVHMLRRPGNFKNPVFTKRKMVVTMAEQKFIKLADVIDGINATDAPRLILVWSEFVSALEEAHRILTERGISSEFVHGEMSKQRRREIFQSWGQQFQVLLAARLMEEGVDFPEIAHGILIAGAKTTRQTVQRVGRLLRPMPNKTARLWVLFCERTMEEEIVQLIDMVTE